MTDKSDVQLFDDWYFTQPSDEFPEFPMCTELLFRVCGNNPIKFDVVNKYLERAFHAGLAAGRSKS